MPDESRLSAWPDAKSSSAALIARRVSLHAAARRRVASRWARCVCAKPQSRRNVLRAVHAAGDAVGLHRHGRERVGVHDLRHSCIAIALASGMTLPEAAALARHASPGVTATVY